MSACPEAAKSKEAVRLHYTEKLPHYKESNLQKDKTARQTVSCWPMSGKGFDAIVRTDKAII